MFPKTSPVSPVNSLKVLKLDKIVDGFRLMFSQNKVIKDYQIKVIAFHNKWKVIIQEYNGGLLGEILGYIFNRFNKIQLSAKKATIFRTFADAMGVIKTYLKPLEMSVVKFHKA